MGTGFSKPNKNEPHESYTNKYKMNNKIILAYQDNVYQYSIIKKQMIRIFKTNPRENINTIIIHPNLKSYFLLTDNRKRGQIYDFDSNLYNYDIRSHKCIWTKKLIGVYKKILISPDGEYLIICINMPNEY